MKVSIILFSVAFFLIILFAGTYFLFQAGISDSSSETHDHEGEKSNILDSQSGNTSAGSTNGASGKSKNKQSAQSKVLGVSSSTGKSGQSQNNINNISNEVIDQKLNVSAISQENEKIIASNVLGAEKEKINIEFILLDGEENKNLENYAVEIKYKYNNGASKAEKLSTDANGKIVFNTTESGFVTCQIFTKDFSIFTKNFVIRHGLNKHVAKLFKGGRIEVKATNLNDKIVEGLTASLGVAGWRGRQTSDYIPLELDPVRGLYFLDNVPLGTQDLSFKAPGYIESASYKMVVETKNTAFLNIRLNPARVIKIDLDVPTKPDSINVAVNRNMRNNINNRVPRGNANAVVPQNTTNLDSQRETSSMQTGQSSELPGGLPGGYGNRENNRNRGGVGGGGERRNLNFNSNEQLVLKNPDGLYFVELENRYANSLTVYADRFAPQDVVLSGDIDLYRITLIEGASAELLLNDENGNPIDGVTVRYSSGSFRQNGLSGVDGVAQLVGLKDSMNLNINITKKNYATQNINWSFNVKEQNSKTVVLLAAKGISGIIKFEGKPVMGARVLLIQSGRNFPINRVESANDGYYSFDNVDMAKDKAYTIKAFHREFGVASSDRISFEEQAEGAKDTGSNTQKKTDLTLVKEKSVSIKLIDAEGKPIPNKNISLLNNMEPEFSLSEMTNENGLLEIYNFMHGFYNVRLEDESLKVKNRNIQIPSDEIVLTVESKILKKVIVTEVSGRKYTGPLNVSLDLRRNTISLELITGVDGSYNLEIREDIPLRFGTLVFEAPGFASVRLGPYERPADVPNELIVELQVGDRYKVKVVDDKSNSPIPFVPVNIFSGRSKIQSLPTNDIGEIEFGNLGRSFIVTVREDNYCEFTSEIDGNTQKEIQIRLIKGGGIKGHLTLGKEYTFAWISLLPSGGNLQLDAEGNFEFKNVIPGEYTLSVTRATKDGKNEIEKIPLTIVVENEKTFEVNLDEFQKNQTTLDVSVFKDGMLSNELGFLNITDRRGQSVVSSQINNGKFKIERILPGEYLLSYNYLGRPLQKNLGILPNANNVVDIFVPGSNLTVVVKNEEGAPIPKAMVTLYAGEKYRQEDSYRGIQIVCDGNGVGNFFLMPKAPYYIVVEEDFRFNYQVNVYGPIILDAGQSTKIDYVLPYARKLPKILITDNANKPLPDAGFVFNDEGGNFFQRTLKKEWDLFPYSNKSGYLPENCWPKGNFTLIVGKEGFDFREVVIPADFDSTQLLHIKLNKASSIRCNFNKALPLPISVGILNKNGVLLQKPIPLTSRNKNELTVYFENISMGTVSFSDLAAGVYYIGYFWNGSDRLITRQGPIQLGIEENLNVTSSLSLSDY